MELRNTPLNLNSRLDILENADNWQPLMSECDVCHRQSLRHYCHISNSLVCTDCAVKEFKIAAKAEEVSNYSFEAIRKLISSGKSLRWRFLFLNRFDEIYQKENRGKYFAMKVMLVEQLGYVVRHPLSWHVRQLAYDICLRLGKEIMPFLIKLYRREPWQFQINVTMLATSINPTHEKVQFMIKEAMDNPNKEVRRHLIGLLRGIDATNLPWMESILLELSADRDPKVRDMAKEYLIKSVIQKRTHKEIPTNQLSLDVAGKTLLDIYEDFKKQQTNYQRAVESNIQEIYTAARLRRILNIYIIPILKEQNLINIDISLSKLGKKHLTTIFTHVFLDEKLFRLMYSRFSPGMRKSIEKLVWENDRYPLQEIEKIIGRKAVVGNERIAYYDLDRKLVDEFLLFQTNVSYSYWQGFSSGIVYLHPQIKAIFKKHLPFPKKAIIRSVKKIPENLRIYSNENNFARSANLFIEYLKQGNVKYSKSNRAALKNSLRKWVSYFDIREFYPDGDRYLEFLFSNLVINFLRELEPNTPNPKTVNDVKKMILDYFNNKKFEHYFELSLVNYIYGELYRYKHKAKYLRKMFFKILKEVSQLGWISISNLVINIRCREEEFNLLPFKQNLDYLYINLPSRYHYSFYQRTYITKEMYNDVFFAPLVKGMFFLFAALGIVDIAYDLPFNKNYQLKNRNYLCPFEGLKFIRVNEFGKYVLGLVDNFDIKQEDEPTHITLDSKRLLITIEGSGHVERMILLQMAEKVTENRYKMSFRSFLQNCQSANAIKRKINAFKEYICSDPPEIWQQFFRELEEKINPLQERNEFRIFKITPNRELISLIANDKILKGCILKMENYHIAIEEQNVRKVVERLREFGFFVNNL